MSAPQVVRNRGKEPARHDISLAQAVVPVPVPPPLKHVRTNDGALAEGREFREFVVALDGPRLQPNTLENTPALVFFEPESSANTSLAYQIASVGKRIGMTGFAFPSSIMAPIAKSTARRK
jgi:hypothetical protein